LFERIRSSFEEYSFTPTKLMCSSMLTKFSWSDIKKDRKGRQKDTRDRKTQETERQRRHKDKGGRKTKETERQRRQKDKGDRKTKETERQKR